MKLIDRYILSYLVGPFLFGMFLVVFLFLMQFLVIRLDHLVGKGIDTLVILELISLNIPWMLVLAVPIGILFGSLMAFGSMSSSHEITIVKASGGSLFRMILPVLLFGIVLSSIMYWFNDKVLPEANHKGSVLFRDIKKTKPTLAIEQGQFTTDLEGYTILARKVDSLSGKMSGLTIYDNSKIREKNIINAEYGFLNFTNDYNRMLLDLHSGEIHQSRRGEVKEYKKIDFEQYQIFMKADGFEFVESEGDLMKRGNRELSIADMEKITAEGSSKLSRIDSSINQNINRSFAKLMGYCNQSDSINKRSKIEYFKFVKSEINYLKNQINSDIYQEKKLISKNRELATEIEKKLAIPLACFIFIFVGCPLGILSKKGNFGISAAYTLGFYIIYWMCLISGEKLADRGILDPFYGIWMGNFVVGIIGIFVSLKVSYELEMNPFKFITSLFRK